MSYLLDALNKSQQENNQALPDVLNQAQPAAFVDEYETDKKPTTHYFFISVIVLLLVVIAFLLGKNQPESKHSITENALTIQPPLINKPKPSFQISEDDIPVAVRKNEFAKKFDTPRLANQVQREVEIAQQNKNKSENYIDLKQNRPEPKKADIVRPSSTEEGIVLTGKRLTMLAEDESVVSAEESIDAKLSLKFEQAIAETMAMSDEEISTLQTNTNVQNLSKMPLAIQDAIPTLLFQTHIYSTEPADRWVKVNNKIVAEGEEIEAGVFIQEIQPQFVIMAYKDEVFSLPALQNW